MPEPFIQLVDRDGSKIGNGIAIRIRGFVQVGTRAAVSDPLPLLLRAVAFRK